MKLFDLLFTCNTFFSCPYAKAEAMARVHKAFTDDRAMRLSPIQASEDELTFDTKREYLLEKNSFYPEVSIRFRDADAGTAVQTQCRIKQLVQIFAYCYTVLLALIELLLLIMLFRGTLSSPLLLLIPVVLFVFQCTMTFFGIRLSSRDVLYVIRTALKQDESNT